MGLVPRARGQCRTTDPGFEEFRSWLSRRSGSGLDIPLLGRRRRDQAVPDRLLSRKLALAAYRVGLLSGRFLGRLLVEPTSTHFPEQTFALHLLLQHAQRLFDVVVADEYLHQFDPRIAPDTRGRCLPRQ